MQNIFDLDFFDLQNIIIGIRLPDYRTNQVWQGVYQHLYSDWDEFSNLPKELKNYLKSNFSLNTVNQIDKKQSLDNSSEKNLLLLEDGKLIETVVLSTEKRNTLCLSTQSGCPVGCVFCATGRMGFGRNLTSGEIVEQVILFKRECVRHDVQLDNIVFMGMGEPFLNYDQVIRAIRLMNDPKGLNIGARRITVSTIGIVDKIYQFAEENMQVNLAISLHAATDELRQQLIPIATSESIAKIMLACNYYLEKTGRRLTFEYVMIRNINDSAHQAKILAGILENMKCHVNLIPLNQNSHYPGEPSLDVVVSNFKKILLNKRIATSLRYSKGADIMAGCGQLAGNR